MIYSKDDVIRMLTKIRTDIEPISFFYKNDNIPPKVVLKKELLMILNEIEQSL